MRGMGGEKGTRRGRKERLRGVSKFWMERVEEEGRGG